MPEITISIERQQLILYQKDKPSLRFSVSTALNGTGQVDGSYSTPLGRHLIRAKFGGGTIANTVFSGRSPTGEVYSAEYAKTQPNRDWILTRILWLTGMQPGKNRFGTCDTMQRFIYIHGCPDQVPIGTPLSHGCIRMRNPDIVMLYDLVPVYTRVTITP